MLFSGFPATKQDVGLFLRIVSFPEHETVQICNLWSASDVSVGSLINSLERNYVWKSSFSPFTVNSSEEPASFPTGGLIDLWGVCRQSVWFFHCCRQSCSQTDCFLSNRLQQKQVGLKQLLVVAFRPSSPHLAFFCPCVAPCKNSHVFTLLLCHCSCWSFCLQIYIAEV